MEFAQPPPNLSMPPPGMPPPNVGVPPPVMGGSGGYNNNRPPFRPFMNVSRPLPGALNNMTLEDFDGKRLRKSVMRKTVDYNSAIIEELENRVWQRDFRDRRALQPDAMYYPDMMPPPSYPDNPINCVTTRFVKTATNKMRCPIFCMAWTPEGRRLVTGASSGEFTLWNGLTFNFETILQAHDSPVRTMVWSHNDSWMVTGDHAGYVKYWQSNMNNVKMFQAHKEALRGISFSPSDNKFVTCSDDGTLRIWDFFRYQEERILRGHGADVKCVHWHPQKSLIISGSKDNQQPIKLWDPKTGQSLATLHAHKSTVMDLKWNDNGNWLITASRDHLLKLFDLRNLSQEVQTFRGHKKEASSVAWHPTHEGLFSSGGSDGAIMFWHVGADKEVGAIEQAHDSIVWTLAWHPLGHILCSGSNDHTSKFWTRNRPGDQMRDKYNLNTLPAGIAGLEDMDLDNYVGDEPASIIPGMGPEDKVDITSIISDGNATIPGLDLDPSAINNDDKPKAKKVPFSKPIPRNFQAQWNETDDPGSINEVITQLVENTPGVVPLQKIAPNAIIIYGKLIPVEAGSKLEQAISEGPDALQKYIDSGEIEELHDVMPIRDDDEEDYLRDPLDDDDADHVSGLVTGIHGGQAHFEPPPGAEALKAQPDKDMRYHAGKDSDMRAKSKPDFDFRPPPQDEDFRGSGRDFDMRNMNERGDDDYSYGRGGGGDKDFRKSRYEDEDYDDDYYDYQRNGNSSFGSNQGNGGGGFNNSSGGFGQGNGFSREGNSGGYSQRNNYRSNSSRDNNQQSDWSNSSGGGGNRGRSGDSRGGSRGRGGNRGGSRGGGRGNARGQRGGNRGGGGNRGQQQNRGRFSM
ncbi:unnamed protein product [Brassicogethes aeneus]|uniref:Pre-mRNA 3' end processing protein WDR33 n=1 Tax=Brassicogethes aeneus TaxID=1431903 RepID=A0A9P0B939_BRAAE|nr:unnamed protein product [Brassicogethes aeneus]